MVDGGDIGRERMQKYENWSSERAADVVRQHADRACAALMEEIAQSIARDAKARSISLEIVHSELRDLHRLEHLIENETGTGRIACGPPLSASLNHNSEPVKKGLPDGGRSS